MEMGRSKAELLASVDRAYATWRELTDAAGAIGFETPGIGGGWTYKEVAGHLNGWRVRTVARLEAAAAGTEPEPAPWPARMSTETDEGTDEINAWIDSWYASRPVEEILAEADDQFARIRAAVERIPDHDLAAAGRFSWLGDFALAAVVEGSAEHLHDEHESDIRAWLAANTP